MLDKERLARKHWTSLCQNAEHKDAKNVTQCTYARPRKSLRKRQMSERQMHERQMYERQLSDCKIDSASSTPGHNIPWLLIFCNVHYRL